MAMNEESGQAVTEYLLLVIAIVGFYLIVAASINRLGVSNIFTRPLKGSFASAYRYGHVKGKGYDDGGPANHPRAVGGGENNFRLFMNSEVK